MNTNIASISWPLPGHFLEILVSVTFLVTLPAFGRPEQTAEHNRPTPFGLAAPLQFTSAVSRKTHTGGGTFDVPLPLVGARGIEPRTGGTTGNHTIVVTFNSPVLSGNAALTSGTGTVTGPPTFSGNTMTVNLTGVTNAQTLTVTLSNVTDYYQVLPNTAITAGFLQGDSNGDGTVNSGDALQTRNRSGQTTDAANFRSDANTDGFINSGDTVIVRSRSGTVLPPLMNSCVENFDGVTAPALPAGWTRSNPIPGSNGIMWVTSTVAPDTGPNDAFIDDQDGVSDKDLDSRNIMILSASAQVSFRSNFNTEYFTDGGVLEVSSPNITDGAFTDVTDPAVGGRFISGGYTGEIGNNGNPLAGRFAWCGDSGGYITTAVNLGPNLNGQTIKLRFRMGTDEAVSRPGWHIDTLSIMGATCP